MDAFFDTFDQKTGIGHIIRSSNGEFISARTNIANDTTAEEGECKAIYSAVRAWLDNQLKDLVIETDCQNATHYFNGLDVNISLVVSSILNQVKDLAVLFNYMYVLNFVLDQGMNVLIFWQLMQRLATTILVSF
ncbi:hypothetical protein FRX31_020106 [Thalictrum thalictroides]|uniref:RNase H type-1 domain-containing protein n=1 Tax=Thalictrum thalictroides TaxID=46969 RepID=A0A7J6W030_THATH|nr:hypothetical protein FRX31_020106 [Thalictrum thalictroides]